MDQLLTAYYPLVIDSSGEPILASADDCSKQGFWLKLDLFKGCPPQSRENAMLLHHYLRGADCLTLFGGTVPSFGNYDYKVYSADLMDRSWRQI
jgi:hypothetical protein